MDNSHLPWYIRHIWIFCHNLYLEYQMIIREYVNDIKNDLDKKIVLLSGPRQCGKTTLSKALFNNFQYLSYDLSEHQKIILSKTWDRSRDLIIFDEIHKMNDWKLWLKGIFDVEGVRPRLLVTGSARLETYTNVGDSLAGRFFSYRLHPLTVEELAHAHYDTTSQEVLERMMKLSGFPEPFLEKNSRFYQRWQKSHLDTILREDLLNLSEIKDILKMKTLVTLLEERIASPLSFSSLAEDLGTSYKTVQKWVSLLEKLYIIFRIHPYHENIARSLTKEPKYYFYDIGRVKNEGARFENLIACALQKKVHEFEDRLGQNASLNYLRDRDGKEVDFFCQLGNRKLLIEAKLSDDGSTKLLKYFQSFIPDAESILIVKNLRDTQSTLSGFKIVKAHEWLTKIGVN